MTKVFPYLGESTLREDTAKRQRQSAEAKDTEADRDNEHQQTGFTAGTVTDDHELSADLSHDDG